MPSSLQAGDYSAALQYLNAVKAAGTDDADKVVAQLKKTKINDMFAKNGYIRDDGRMVHDMYLMQVKTPDESTEPWDYYNVVETFKGDAGLDQPRPKSKCALVEVMQRATRASDLRCPQRTAPTAGTAPMEIFGIPLQALLGQLLLGLVNGSFYAMLCLGLAVIFGLLNIVNFAHGALYMIGAFVAWFGARAVRHQLLGRAAAGAAGGRRARHRDRAHAAASRCTSSTRSTGCC